MAEPTDQAPEREEEAESQEQEEATSTKPEASQGRSVKKTLAICLIAALVIQGVGVLCYKLGRAQAVEKPAAEIDLGKYYFSANSGEDGPTNSAEFRLHIALLEQVAGPAQQRLLQRQYRVQQDVEQLLRRAHGGDFEDPILGELKRQLQEQINDTLGMRAIADVIITDLKLEDGGRPRVPVADTADSVPWTEKSG